MCWVDVIGCVAEIVPPVVDVLCQCILFTPRSQPPPKSDDDNRDHSGSEALSAPIHDARSGFRS